MGSQDAGTGGSCRSSARWRRVAAGRPGGVSAGRARTCTQATRQRAGRCRRRPGVAVGRCRGRCSAGTRRAWPGRAPRRVGERVGGDGVGGVGRWRRRPRARRRGRRRPRRVRRGWCRAPRRTMVSAGRPTGTPGRCVGFRRAGAAAAGVQELGQVGPPGVDAVRVDLRRWGDGDLVGVVAEPVVAPASGWQARSAVDRDDRTRGRRRRARAGQRSRRGWDLRSGRAAANGARLG